MARIGPSLSVLALLLPAIAGAAPVQEETNSEEVTAGEERYGRWLGTIGGLREPSAVVVDARGRIWVAEEVADRVRAFDAQGEVLVTLGEAGDLLAPSGLAVAADGTVFVADGGHHRVRRYGPDGTLRGEFGGWGAGPGELNGPRGLAVDGDLLWVADARNHRLQAFTLEGEPRASIGGYGNAEGRFNRPSGVAVDGAGSLYVADSGNHRVQKLDREGRCLRAWGDFGPWLGFFANPTDVAWRDGRVLVVDRENHRVQVFSDGGDLAYDWGVHALLPREGDGKLHYPERIAAAPDGAFIALAESFEDRVQLFGPWPGGVAPAQDPLRFERDQSAHYGAGVSIAGETMVQVEPGAPSLLTWDLEPDAPVQVNRYRVYGRRFGQLLRPVDAAVDLERELIHLADPGNRRLVSYGFRPRAEGEELRYDPFLLKMVRSLNLDRIDVPIDPEALACGADGRLFVADVSQRAVFVFRHDLELLGPLEHGGAPFLRPVDVTLDSERGRLLVVDQLDRRVRRFALEPTGTAARELESLGGPGEAAGALLRPAGVEVLADGRTWVSDGGRHRLVEYAPDGTLARTLGGPGTGRVEFHKPRGLARDGRGRVFVIDWGNHRGQILDGDGGFLHAFGARLFTRPTRLQR